MCRFKRFTYRSIGEEVEAKYYIKLCGIFIKIMIKKEGVESKSATLS
jgi:hypothetical protein